MRRGFENQPSTGSDELNSSRVEPLTPKTRRFCSLMSSRMSFMSDGPSSSGMCISSSMKCSPDPGPPDLLRKRVCSEQAGSDSTGWGY